MKKQNRKNDKQNGSALILVVVVTVLLAVIGVMFLMVSRASEMETAAVIESKDLDNAVDTVVSRINEVLVEDLFGANGFDPNLFDATTVDPWLCDLEPTFGANLHWSNITDLWGFFNVPVPPALTDYQQIPLDDFSGTTNWWEPRNPLETLPYDQSDADGDGVADSRWVQMPGLTTSRGEPVFAAVRIIDNCAMLNLNAAHCFYQAPYNGVSPFEKPWFENDAVAVPYHDNQSAGSGRYLTEINYLSFLRGSDLASSLLYTDSNGDNWYNLMQAKGFWDTGTILPLSPFECQAVLMDIENPITDYQFFDIGDELELRNRYLLTSKTESRIEQKDVANFSLDSGGGNYSALKMPREDKMEGDFSHIDRWFWRVNPANFDEWSGADARYEYLYDRRHVCTVYSYDRPLPKGEYLTLGPIADETVRSVFMPKGTATTNIETPLAVDADGNSVPYNNIETRRKILHLLFAFREYFYQQNGKDLSEAAKSAAQVVANLIDYSDDDAIVTTSSERQGPFYDDGVTGPIDYGAQANVDCTFITEKIIEDMIDEVSGGLLPAGSVSFGLDAADVIFGYEKQPFISEVYANRDSSGVLLEFAIELLNPYDEDLKLVRDKIPNVLSEDAWRIKVEDGSAIDAEIAGIGSFIPKYDDTTKVAGRYVIRTDPSVPLATGSSALTFELSSLSNMGGGNYEIQLLRPAPKWVLDNLGIAYIVIDIVSANVVDDLWNDVGQSAVKRLDDRLQFIYADDSRYELQNAASSYTHTLGIANNVTTVTQKKDFQIAVSDDGQPLMRWHELEVMGLYGNGPESSDPNAIIQTVSSEVANLDLSAVPHFDLAKDVPNILDYIATINRPDKGSLPGRININTAPKHVIAAAIPPTLADPNAADPAETVAFSALQLAQEIIDYRESPNGPFESVSELLNVSGFRQYDDSGAGAWIGENVGAQSIEDDIEEEHWVLSNLANKFTVRSDVFTAYILVRLGETGPQRRMIGIFDRSQVWSPSDRPKLVALHPVPDPR